MKNIRFFIFVLILGALVLSACGAAGAAATAAPAAVSGSAKTEAMPVAFIGIVDSITGDQWVISGTRVTVDESVVRDGPFQAGDRVKVEGLVNPDGSLSVSRVESPTPQAAATEAPVSVDNSNEAIGNVNTSDANINDGNINDDSSLVNSNDDNGNDDNSNDSNINDDNGGNTNDDDSNDDNSNDDHGGNSNDDNSGKGGGDDDSGGNSNDD